MLGGNKGGLFWFFYTSKAQALDAGPQCAPYRNTTKRKRRITRHLGLNSAALTSFASRASINTFAALSVKIDMDADKLKLTLNCKKLSFKLMPKPYKLLKSSSKHDNPRLSFWFFKRCIDLKTEVDITYANRGEDLLWLVDIFRQVIFLGKFEILKFTKFDWLLAKND